MNVFGYTSSHTVIATSITHRFLPLFEKIKDLEKSQQMSASQTVQNGW
jgi:dimeric dUTPase (all-alpha-NTP-PPase superfamily)